MADITLVEAVTQALAYELANDENVIVFGEDVGKNGGVFRATAGLQERFGENRDCRSSNWHVCAGIKTGC